MTQNILERKKHGPVPDVFVSEDQGLLCIDIEVSSPMCNTARIRISRGVKEWARQPSEFEGTDTVVINGGTRVAHARRSRICTSEHRLRFILTSHRHHHPTGCTQARRISPFVKDVGIHLAVANEIRTSL